MMLALEDSKSCTVKRRERGHGWKHKNYLQGYVIRMTLTMTSLMMKILTSTKFATKTRNYSRILENYGNVFRNLMNLRFGAQQTLSQDRALRFNSFLVVTRLAIWCANLNQRSKNGSEMLIYILSWTKMSSSLTNLEKARWGKNHFSLGRI